MSAEAKVFYEQWAGRMSKAKSAAPDAAKGFGALFQSVMKDGAVSLREKDGNAVRYSIRLPLVFELCGLVCNGLRDQAEARARLLR